MSFCSSCGLCTFVLQVTTQKISCLFYWVKSILEGDRESGKEHCGTRERETLVKAHKLFLNNRQEGRWSSESDSLEHFFSVQSNVYHSLPVSVLNNFMWKRKLSFILIFNGMFMDLSKKLNKTVFIFFKEYWYCFAPQWT